jgi:hypothetical protein
LLDEPGILIRKRKPILSCIESIVGGQVRNLIISSVAKLNMSIALPLDQ